MRNDGTITVALAAALLVAMPQSADAQITWDQGRWRIEARESRVERHEGRDALFLQNGTAWLQGSGAQLQDGVIRFDMRVSGGLGFHGIAFRAVDGQNYEHFYLRPFVSGNPDASAYTPVFNGNSGWQIYSDARFGLPVTVATDRWIHVELRVRGGRAEAYVDGQPLVFPALQRPITGGGIGLTSSGAGARFANLVVTPGAPDLERRGPARMRPPIHLASFAAGACPRPLPRRDWIRPATWTARSSRRSNGTHSGRPSWGSRTSRSCGRAPPPRTLSWPR
jgi:hypothetical protein